MRVGDAECPNCKCGPLTEEQMLARSAITKYGARVHIHMLGARYMSLCGTYLELEEECSGTTLRARILWAYDRDGFGSRICKRCLKIAAKEREEWR